MEIFKNERTLQALKNAGGSLLLKGGSILITFILVPITLGYLNSYEYGIWLTLNSVLSWIYLLDIGIGNGLRNKLTEALTQKDYVLAKRLVSTAFAFTGIIIFFAYGIFLMCQHNIDWYYILNVKRQTVQNLSLIITIIFGIISINFIFKLIGNIFMALQHSVINDLFVFIANLVSLIIIYLLTKFTSGSLLLVSITFTGIPTLIYIISFPITFHYFPLIKPSLKYIHRRYFKDLISLGIKFLFIQLSGLIIYMSSNFLISHIFGPEEVTPYNIAYKYYSIVATIFAIILTPFWSAITEAKIKNDYHWIKRTVKHLFSIWVILVICVLIMIVVAPTFYKFWIGDKVQIPRTMTILFGIYIVIFTFCNLLSYIINGFGCLKISMIMVVLQAIIYLPLAILLSKVYGVIGIILALCIITGISLIWAPFQTYLLINNRAKGIWNE